MAINGFSTSNYLLATAAAVSGPPLTYACWFKKPTSATQVLMCIGNTAVNGDRFVLGNSAAGNGTLITGNASTTGTATTTTVLPLNSWIHLTGVIASTSSRTIYVDGVGEHTDTTSVTPSGVNRTAVGVRVGTSIVSPTNGMLAEVGIWSAALEQVEITALANGCSPLLIRPSNLVLYCPLPSRGFLGNLISGLPIAETGTLTEVSSDSPKIVCPRQIQVGYTIPNTGSSPTKRGGRVPFFGTRSTLFSSLR